MAFTRRNLPHLHFDWGVYFVTSRLTNTLPEYLYKDRKAALKSLSDGKLFDEIDKILDSGIFGPDYLKNDYVAEKLKECLHFPDGKEYDLICYTVMSNHFHVVFHLLENNKGLSDIMKSIKGVSARRSNLVLNRSGTFWQDESYDRLVRNDKELYKVIRYVLLNPVKAGLVDKSQEWKYSYCCENYSFLEF